MRRNKQWEKEKYLLSLFRQKDDLTELKYNFPYLELDKPYQRGWYISVQLRDDFAKSKYSELYLELLSLGFQDGYPTRNVKLIKVARANRTLNFDSITHGKYNDYYFPRKVKFTPKEYNKFRPGIQKHFRKGVEYGREYYVLNLPSYMFRIKVNPYMITHVKLIDGDILSEIAHLENKIESLQGWGRVFGKRSNWDRGLQSYDRHSKEFKKLFKQEIDGLYSNNCED